VGKILLLYLLPAALLIYALIDCALDANVERTNLPKWAWILIIVLVTPYIGALAWLLVAKVARPADGSSSPRRRGPGPKAPDDDPEFLRKLAEDQWRRQRDAGRDKDGPNGGK
jgi:hypothetical protein